MISQSLDISPVAQRKQESANKSPQTKRAAPQPPMQTEALNENEKSVQAKEAVPAVPAELEAFDALCLEDKKTAGLEAVALESSGLAVSVPKTIGAELIELVRRNTNLSYELSRVAIGVVIGHIQTSVPAISSIMEQILISLVENKVGKLMNCFHVQASRDRTRMCYPKTVCMLRLHLTGFYRK